VGARRSRGRAAASLAPVSFAFLSEKEKQGGGAVRRSIAAVLKDSISFSALCAGFSSKKGEEKGLDTQIFV